MLLVYFDEAKVEPEYPHYHIGAVAVERDSLKDVEARIAEIASEAFGTSELSRATELHAADIYHRKKNFKHERDFGARIGVLEACIDILASAEVHLIDIRINCDRMNSTDAPDDIAFMFLCERANDLASAKNTLGMLIGDRESDRVAEQHARSLSDYRRTGTGFAYGRDIENLVDSVHFTHSHLSRFLQLSDIYTWCRQFMKRNLGSTDPRHRALLDILESPAVNLFPAKYKIWPSED